MTATKELMVSLAPGGLFGAFWPCPEPDCHYTASQHAFDLLLLHLERNHSYKVSGLTGTLRFSTWRWEPCPAPLPPAAQPDTVTVSRADLAQIVADWLEFSDTLDQPYPPMDRLRAALDARP